MSTKFLIRFVLIIVNVAISRGMNNVTLLTKQEYNGTTAICVTNDRPSLTVRSKTDTYSEEFSLKSANNEYLNALLSFDVNNKFEIVLSSKASASNYIRIHYQNDFSLEACIYKHKCEKKTIKINEYIVDNKLEILINPTESILYILKLQQDIVINFNYTIDSIKIRTKQMKEIVFTKSDYGHFNIGKKGETKLLKIFNHTQGNKLCFSFFLLMCRDCQIKLIFESQNGLDKSYIYKMQSIGKNVIELTNLDEGEIFVYASAMHNGDRRTNNVGYWIVDGFQVCNSKHYDILSYNSDKMNHFKCAQALSESSISDSDTISNDVICTDQSYLGHGCDISCKDVTNTTHCQKYKICRFKDNEGKCTCASGYKGEYCQSECDDGYYGYNCNKKCYLTNCLSQSCDKSSGYCHQCIEGYILPFCNETIYPVLLNNLTIISIGINNIRVGLNNKKYIGQKQPKYFRIQYESLDSKWLWSGEFYSFKTDVDVMIRNLKKSSTYRIRAILFEEKDGKYIENTPYIIATTTCKDIDSLKFNTNSTSIKIIYPKQDVQICNHDEYRLFLNEKELYFDLDGVCYQRNLKPSTDYQFKICKKNTKTCIFTKNIKTEEDAPSEVTDVTTSSGTYQIKVQWNRPKEINGLLRNYVVNYTLINHVGCSDQNENHYSSSRVTKNTAVYLDNLVPYAKYEIRIYAKTIRDGSVVNRIVSTLPIKIAYLDEIVSRDLVTTVEYSNNVQIKWEPLKCHKRKGPLNYNFYIKCHDSFLQEWCKDEKRVHVNAFNESTVVTNLIPYTNYELYISATRTDSTYETDLVFIKDVTTKSDAPPPIQKIYVFTKDVNFLVLQWSPPYPPYGQIEYYKIFIKQTNLTISIKKNDIKNCKIWSEYICYNITNLMKDTVYWIEVYAKNFHSNDNALNTVKKDLGISVKTIQEAATEPINLTHSWSNNTLMLHWMHPRQENGPIKQFLISLKLNSTQLLAEKSVGKVYNEFYEVTHPQREYTYEVRSKFLLSSTYNINVCGINNFYGQNSTDYFVAPTPEQPRFSSQHFTYDIESENLLRIHLPGVDLQAVSNQTYLYVIVTRLEDGLQKTPEYDDQDFCNSIHKRDLSFYYGKNSWISFEIKLNKSMKSVLLGDNKSITSSLLKSKSFLNKKLNLHEESYNIHFALITKYYSKSICKIYKLPIFVANKTNSAVYSLILLLILPIIAIIGYQMYKRKKSNKNKINTDEPLITQEMDIMAIVNDTGDETNSPLKISVNRRTTDEGHTDSEWPNVFAKPVVHPKPNVRDKPTVLPKPKVFEKSNGKENSGGDDLNGSEIKSESKPALPEKLKKPTVPTKRILHSKLINVSDLEEYVRNAIENEQLNDQHKLFQRGQTKPWDYGIKSENKFKNRYANLAAYDHNRVVLKRINGDSYSDYINASFIDGYRCPRAYIATQGPKITTINDFWRMIWQENVHNIVMLANLIEGGKKKCEKYWPELEEIKTYGEVKVTHLKNDIYADYEYRTFQVSYKNSNRTIEHYHFTSWPDHGVPVYPQSLIPFLKKIVNLSYKTGPITVHCSAGVGRTGTIILSDICLRMAIAEGKVDVLRYLQELREQRINMVDNIDQYILVYTLLMEYLIAPETSLSCVNFKQTLERIKADGTITRHFNYLKQTLWQDEKFINLAKYNNKNDFKNRIKTIVPKAEQIYISFSNDDPNSNYINAVPVDGFRLKNYFIATQIPMPDTIQDFWAMIKEQNISVIVALNEVPIMDKTCCQYYPSVREQLTTSRDLTLAHLKTELHDFYDVVYLEMKSNNRMDKQYLVQLIQIKGWNYDKKVPNDSEMLFNLFEDVEIISRAKQPICVTCYDGTTACGLFIALSFVIEKIKLEQQVDVCLAVRIIRRNRLEFVRNEKQFKFLYEAADEFLDKFENYSNFK